MPRESGKVCRKEREPKSFPRAKWERSGGRCPEGRRGGCRDGVPGSTCDVRRVTSVVRQTVWIRSFSQWRWLRCGRDHGMEGGAVSRERARGRGPTGGGGSTGRERDRGGLVDAAWRTGLTQNKVGYPGSIPRISFISHSRMWLARALTGSILRGCP